MTYNEKLFMLSCKVILQEHYMQKADEIDRLDTLDKTFKFGCSNNKGVCDSCCIQAKCLLYYGRKPGFHSALKSNINASKSDEEVIMV